MWVVNDRPAPSRFPQPATKPEINVLALLFVVFLLVMAAILTSAIEYLLK